MADEEEKKEEEEKPEEEEKKEEEEKPEEDDKEVEKMAKVLDKFWDAKKLAEKTEDEEEKSKNDMKSMKLFADGTKSAGELDGKQKTQEFVKALLTEDKVKLQALVEGTPALGGYLVPEEWHQQIIESLRDEQVIEQRCTVIPIKTDTYHVVQNAGRPKAKYRSELGIKNTSTAEWTEITLTPYSMAVDIPLSDELVEDASIGGNVVAQLTRLISQCIAERAERAYINGTGVGMPSGLMLAAYVALYTNVNAGGALASQHINSAYYRLTPGYRRKAFWIMNSRTLENVHAFRTTTNALIFPDVLTVNGLPSLKGRPVLEQNDMPSDDILLGDLSAYMIVNRGGIRVDTSREATITGDGSFWSAWERDALLIRASIRHDAEVTDTNAFVRISNTGVS